MHAQMERCASSLVDAVVAIRIGHVVKLLAQFDEAVDEALDDFEVGVRFARAVDDQQLSLEAFGEIDG